MMLRRVVAVSALIAMLVLSGCSASDPNNDSWYQKAPLYVWDSGTSAWVQVTGAGGGGGGTIWYSTAGVPDAGVGNDGDFYLDTATSDVYKKVTGSWAIQLNIQGTAGISGTDGRTILNGSGAPDNSLGSDGDFYIDTVAWSIYGPKSTTWGVGTSLADLHPAKGHLTLGFPE